MEESELVNKIILCLKEKGIGVAIHYRWLGMVQKSLDNFTFVITDKYNNEITLQPRESKVPLVYTYQPTDQVGGMKIFADSTHFQIELDNEENLLDDSKRISVINLLYK